STSTEASQGCRDHHGRSSRTGSASGTAERRPADTTVSGRATARAATTRVSNPRTYTNHGGGIRPRTRYLSARFLSAGLARARRARASCRGDPYTRATAHSPWRAAGRALTTTRPETLRIDPHSNRTYC